MVLQYKPEDLGEFDSLVHMTASDSALPMGKSVFRYIMYIHESA